MPASLLTSPAPTDDQVDRLFAEQRRLDPLGTRIHLWAAIVACFLAGWPTMFVEWALLPVLIVCLVRLTGHRRVPGPLLWDPRVRLLLALCAWMLVSILWTFGTRHEWTGDIRTLRFAWVVLFVYPVLDRRRVLIGALVAGLACGQFVQWGELLGQAISASMPSFHRAVGRHSGWWDPAVGGSVLCAALGLHVGALATSWNAPGRTRWLATAGVIATLVSIVLTGTRGAWIAAVCLLLAGVVLAACSSARRARVMIFGAGGAGVAIALMAAVILSGAWGVRDRLELGLREVRHAIDQGDYSSDTGMRIAMAQWAAREWRERPIIGVGAGGYRAWADRSMSREPDGTSRAGPSLPRPHAHAHNWYLHTLATLGVIGAAIMFTMVGLSIFSGLWWRGVLVRGYDAAPGFALLGLAFVGAFDSIHINQQTAYMLFLLVALCVKCRPALAEAEP